VRRQSNVGLICSVLGWGEELKDGAIIFLEKGSKQGLKKLIPIER